MAGAYGKSVKDYIGVNTAKGTESSAITRYNVIDNSIESNYTKKEREARWGLGLSAGTYNAGEKVDGNINMELTKQTLLDMLLWFGFKKDSVNVKLWNWDEVLKYLTIYTELSDVGYYEVSKDVRMGSMKISLAKASPVKAECSFSAVTMALVDSSVTAITAVKSNVADKDTIIYGSDFTFLLGTDITGDMVSCSINFENGLDLEDTNFSGNRKDMGNGDRKVSIEATMDFDKARYLDLKSKDKTNATTNLKITLGTLEFDFKKVSIDDVKKVMESKNKIKASLKFQLLDNGAIPLTVLDKA